MYGIYFWKCLFFCIKVLKLAPPKKNQKKERKKLPPDDWQWPILSPESKASACGPVTREIPGGQIPRVPDVVLRLRACACLELCLDHAQRASLHPKAHSTPNWIALIIFAQIPLYTNFPATPGSVYHSDPQTMWSQDSFTLLYIIEGTSLVAKWLGIHLPMQGTQLWSLVQEDPMCHRATKSMHHNYGACTLEPGSGNYWSPCTESLCSATGEATTVWSSCNTRKSSPWSLQLNKAPAQQRKPSAAEK